jgi:hypothetical protein
LVVLNRIYTRTGDQGTTALGTGERRPKYDLRIEAYGTVDETNAAIGLDAEGPTLASQIESNPRRSLPEGSVWTLNVSPDSVYGMGCGFNFATFGVLTLGNRFEDWRIQVETVDVPLKF